MSSERKIELGEGYSVSIISEQYNPLIKRRELVLLVYHIGKGTPERMALREAVAKAYQVDEEQVYVRKMVSEFGMGATRAFVHIYDSPERAKEFEPEYIRKRHTGMVVIQAEGGA